MGFNSKSRFGLALSTLGDINRDGYGGELCIDFNCSYQIQYYNKVIYKFRFCCGSSV